LDRDKFEKIFNNYLSNALKYTSKGGSIQVSFYEKNNQIEFAVADTGYGISEEDLPKIFNRFYQAKNTQSSGTGIGLAFCKELAELLNGEVSAESTLGEGSTFRFIFPYQETFEAIEPEETAIIDTPVLLNTENSQHQENRPRILLVEDNPNLQQYITAILSDKYQVMVAENGEEAWKILRVASYELRVRENVQPATRNPQLVISDILMPVMNGFELSEKIKADEQLKNIPLILLTARAGRNDKLKALRIGVDDYLVKPFNEEELLVRIENLLSNAQNRIETTAPETEATSEDTPAEATKKAPQLDIRQQEWLNELETLLDKNLDKFDLTADYLAEQLLISRSQFFRRVKANTGLSPQQYIKEARLQKAREYLELRTYDSVKAVALSVGLKHVKNFSSNFKKRFGRLPSSYL
jgi:DNA-binding response OmpR family regulator